MRVLHVIPSLSPVHGGPSVVLPVMERALTRAGVSVVTITTDDDGPGRHNGLPLEAPQHENGVVRHYFRKQTEFYKVSLGLRRWMRDSLTGCDVVHIHSLFSYTSGAAMRAARDAGVPYVVRPLGVLATYGMTERRALLKRWSLRWLEGPLLRDAAAVHFTDETEQEEALAWGFPMKPVVIPLGLEPVVLPAAESGAAPTVLFLSRLDPKKNIESLLTAWAEIHPHHPQWRLVMAGAGDPDYTATLHARSASLGIAESVKWTGHLESTAKAQALANATIFVLPSFSENFGLAAAEALLAGKACVFSPGVAVGKIAAARGAAVLAEPTATALAGALGSLMTDPEACDRLGIRAREFAEAELSASTMGQRLRALYQQLAGNPTP